MSRVHEAFSSESSNQLLRKPFSPVVVDSLPFGVDEDINIRVEEHVCVLSAAPGILCRSSEFMSHSGDSFHHSSDLRVIRSRGGSRVDKVLEVSGVKVCLQCRLVEEVFLAVGTLWVTTIGRDI
jgi:hypothetical protein